MPSTGCCPGLRASDGLQMTSGFRLTIAALLMMAAFSAPADAQTNGALSATLSVAQRDYAKDADVEVTVTLTNGTSRIVDVAAQALESAVLLVDVRDAVGRKM